MNTAPSAFVHRVITTPFPHTLKGQVRTASFYNANEAQGYTQPRLHTSNSRRATLFAQQILRYCCLPAGMKPVYIDSRHYKKYTQNRCHPFLYHQHHSARLYVARPQPTHAAELPWRASQVRRERLLSLLSLRHVWGPLVGELLCRRPRKKRTREKTKGSNVKGQHAKQALGRF